MALQLVGTRLCHRCSRSGNVFVNPGAAKCGPVTLRLVGTKLCDRSSWPGAPCVFSGAERCGPVALRLGTYLAV